jgi:hypothetical protein
MSMSPREWGRVAAPVSLKGDFHYSGIGTIVGTGAIPSAVLAAPARRVCHANAEARREPSGAVSSKLVRSFGKRTSL